MQIIVVGGGKMGTHLAGRLQADGEAVTIIEARQGDARPPRLHRSVRQRVGPADT